MNTPLLEKDLCHRGIQRSGDGTRSDEGLLPGTPPQDAATTGERSRRERRRFGGAVFPHEGADRYGPPKHSVSCSGSESHRSLALAGTPPSPPPGLRSPQGSARSPLRKRDSPRCDALRVLSAAPGLCCSPEGTVTTPPRLPVATGPRESACNKFYRPSHGCTQVGNRPAEQYAPSADFLRSYRETSGFRCRSNADPQRRSTGAGVGSHG